MTQHKRSGFTIIELAIVIVVVAILATITTVAYRTTQSNARDEKRKADALVLRGALEEYYSQKGDYPRMTCGGGGAATECHNNEVWQVLVDEGMLPKIPIPPSGTTLTAYKYISPSSTSTIAYGVYVILESGGACKFGRNVASFWSGVDECTF